MFLSYSILPSSFLEANHFLYNVFFASVNCFIWSSHIFKCFLLFRLFIFPKLLYPADFRMLLSFSSLSQRLFRVYLYCLKEVSLLVCAAILCFVCAAILRFVCAAILRFRLLQVLF